MFRFDIGIKVFKIINTNLKYPNIMQFISDVNKINFYLLTLFMHQVHFSNTIKCGKIRMSQLVYINR